MSTLSIAARNAACNAVVDLVDAGTAGASGAELILDNAVIAIGQTVTVTAFTHTQPA